jgi:hypothetical protein
MKAHIRIAVKDLQRHKNLKIELARVPFSHNRQFLVKMNGKPWPQDGRPVCLTRMVTTPRKSLVKSVQR